MANTFNFNNFGFEKDYDIAELFCTTSLEEMTIQRFVSEDNLSAFLSSQTILDKYGEEGLKELSERLNSTDDNVKYKAFAEANQFVFNYNKSIKDENLKMFPVSWYASMAEGQKDWPKSVRKQSDAGNDLTVCKFGPDFVKKLSNTFIIVDIDDNITALDVWNTPDNAYLEPYAIKAYERGQLFQAELGQVLWLKQNHPEMVNTDLIVSMLEETIAINKSKTWEQLVGPFFWGSRWLEDPSFMDEDTLTKSMTDKTKASYTEDELEPIFEEVIKLAQIYGGCDLNSYNERPDTKDDSNRFAGPWEFEPEYVYDPGSDYELELHLENMRRSGSKQYSFECCGAMLGRASSICFVRDSEVCDRAVNYVRKRNGLSDEKKNAFEEYIQFVPFLEAFETELESSRYLANVIYKVVKRYWNAEVATPNNNIVFLNLRVEDWKSAYLFLRAVVSVAKHDISKLSPDALVCIESVESLLSAKADTEYTRIEAPHRSASGTLLAGTNVSFVTYGDMAIQATNQVLAFAEDPAKAISCKSMVEWLSNLGTENEKPWYGMKWKEYSEGYTSEDATFFSDYDSDDYRIGEEDEDIVDVGNTAEHELDYIFDKYHDNDDEMCRKLIFSAMREDGTCDTIIIRFSFKDEFKEKFKRAIHGQEYVDYSFVSMTITDPQDIESNEDFSIA